MRHLEIGRVVEVLGGHEFDRSRLEIQGSTLKVASAVTGIVPPAILPRSKTARSVQNGMSQSS